MAVAHLRRVVVDDCSEYRALLSLHLDANDIVVVGEGDDGESGFKAAILTAPDLVVTALRMPGQDGLWLARQLQVQHPTLPVIMTANCADHTVIGADARAAGVAEVVSKRAGAAALADIVRRRLEAVCA